MRLNNIYGVLDMDNCHVDISRSEKAVKRWATMNGYDEISCRFNAGYNVAVVAKRIKGKWVNV